MLLPLPLELAVFRSLAPFLFEFPFYYGDLITAFVFSVKPLQSERR